MKHGFVKRILVMVLCLTLMMSIVIVPAANAATINKSKATFSCTTMNDSVKWILGRSSTVTFKNTGSAGNLVINASASGCTVSPASASIRPGVSKTFTIKTSFGKVGTTNFNVTNDWNCAIVYGISSSGTQLIVRTK